MPIKSSKEFQKMRERFLPHSLKVAIDGISEEWEYKESWVRGQIEPQRDDEMIVRYVLKDRGEYKTGV